MKKKPTWINTRVELQWDSATQQYKEVSVTGYWHEGDVAQAGWIADKVEDAWDWATDDVLNIEGTINFIGNALEGGVEFVGDVLGGAVDFVVDGVEWVGETVVDTVDSFLDDPIGTLITVAAIAYPPLAPFVPLIQAARVGIEGGDLGDMLTAAAVSYVSQGVGEWAGDVASGYVSDAISTSITNETLQEYISGALGSAATGATAALITGQDVGDAIGSSLLSYSANFAKNQVVDYLKTGTLSDELKASMTSGEAQAQADGAAAGEYTRNMNELQKAYNDLNPYVQKGIEGAIGAALNGGDITTGVLQNVMQYAVTTSDFVDRTLATMGIDGQKSYDDAYAKAIRDGMNPDDAKKFALDESADARAQETLAAHVITSSLVTSINGGDAGAVAYNIVLNNGKEALNDLVTGYADELGRYLSESGGTTGAFVDAVTNGKYYGEQLEALMNGDIKTATDKLAEYQQRLTVLKDRQTSVLGVYQPMVTEAQRLYDAAQAKYKDFQSQAELDAYNTAAQKYKDYIATTNFVNAKAAYDALQTDVTKLNTDWTNVYSPVNDKLTNDLIPQFNALNTKYQEAQEVITQASDDVNAYNDSIINQFTKSAVQIATNNTFDPATYKQTLVRTGMVSAADAANLNDQDLYNHYLTIGQKADLPINKVQYQEDILGLVNSHIVGEMARSGLNANTVDPATIEALRTEILSTVDQVGYGQALELFRTTNPDDLNWVTFLEPRDEFRDNYIYSAAGYWENVTGEGQDPFEFIRDNDVLLGPNTTWDDLYDGSASIVPIGMNDDGSTKYGIYNGTDAAAGYEDNQKFILALYGPNASNIIVTQGIAEDGTTMGTAGNTIDTIAEIDITAAYNVARAGIDATGEAVDVVTEGAGKVAIETASLAAEVAQATGSETIQDIAGTVIGGSAELISAFNSALRIGLSADTENGESVATALSEIAQATTSEELQAGTKRLTDTIAAGEGFWGTLKAVGTAIVNEPYAATMYAVSEIGQEFATLGLSKLAKGVTYSTGIFSTLGKEAASTIATKADVAVAVTAELAESYGGAAQEAYNSSKAEFLAAGYSEAAADEGAMRIAHNAGLLNMALASVTLDAKADLGISDAIMPASVKQYLLETTEAFTREGRQELVEEVFTNAYVELELYQVNPDRDWAGNITANGTIATLVGGTTGSAMTLTANTANAISGMLGLNEQVSTLAEAAAAGDQTARAQLGDLLADIDFDIPTSDLVQPTVDLITNDLLAQYNPDLASIEDISNYIADASVGMTNGDSTYGSYVFSADEIQTLVSDYVGQNDAVMQEAIANYVDTRYTDISEVQEEARKEGLLISDEQAAQFVGQTTEADTRTQILAYADQNVTTREEAAAMFDALGYNVTDAELARYPTLQQLQGNITTSDTAKMLRMITGLEPVDTSYDITGEGNVDISDVIKAQRIIKGLEPTSSLAGTRFAADAVSEADVQSAVTDYTDARMVTYDEAKAYLEAQGYQNPTDAQINQFVGQANDPLFTQKQEAAIRTWYDENTVTPEEVQDYYESKGYVFPDNFTPDFSPLTGQYAESELAAKSDDFSGAMLYNMFAGTFDETEKRLTDKIAEYEANGVSRAEAIESAISDLSTQLGTSEETLLKAIGDTGESLRGELDTLQQALADDISALADQLGTTENNLSNAITDLASALGTTEESLVKAIEDGDQVVLDALGSPAEYDGDGNLVNAATGVYRDLAGLAAQLGTTEENLTKNIDALATKLGSTEEALYEAIEAGNTTVLNALGKPAEYDADGNLVNAATGMYRSLASLAEQLGTTEASLNTALGELATQLGTTEASLIAAIEAGDTAVINALDSAIEGVNKDIGAVGDAVATLAKQLGTTEEAILKAVAEGDTEILGALDTAVRDLQVSDALTRDEIQAVADFVGKPYTAVTQDDINFVNAIIAEGATDTDYATIPETQVYDVNQDGIINQADADIMAQLFADPTLAAQLAPESQYAQATGLYQTQQQYAQELQAQQQANLEAQLQAQQQMEQNLATQQQQNYESIIADQQAKAATLAQQGNYNTLLNMLMGAPDLGGQTVSVNTPDPARINYIYDFNSIFANPQQAGMFLSPYKEGGKVDADEELLRFLGVK